MFGLVTASCQKWPPVLPSIRLPERKNPQRSQGFARGSNDKAFTPLMEWAEEVVMPQVRDRFVTLAGASKADANAVKISKDEIRRSVAKFVRFCTANPSGFLIG